MNSPVLYSRLRVCAATAALFAGIFVSNVCVAASSYRMSSVAQASLQRSPRQSDFRRDLDSAREKVYPALVNIAVVDQYFDGGRAHRGPAAGSGVIISPDGYVLTNFHVAGHTTTISCSTADGVTYPADVVGNDSLADISVLKLRLSAGHPPLHYAALGDSDKLQVGDFVLAMGNPLTLSSSMTLGIASNTQRVFTDFTGTQIESQTLESGETTGSFTRWIQHDALILPGNSGGPLVNLQGEVIGINELGGNGIGFAIPSNIAKYVFAQIKEYGVVKRGWLGVDILPVKKLGLTGGALVSGVTPGSPAAKAGVQPGDIITSMNSKPVDVVFFEQVPLFFQEIAAMKSGDKVALGISRAGKPKQATAELQWMTPDLGKEDDMPSAGVTVRDITPSMARARYLPNTDGVYVTGVRSGYPFAGSSPEIQGGDIISTVGSVPVTGIKSFEKAIKDATAASDPSTKTLIGFQRNDQHMLSTVSLVPEPSDQGGGELPSAWLGVRTQVLQSDIAAAMGQPNLMGFRITQVFPYTEASKAGLKVGDVITQIDDTVLNSSRVQDAGDLHQALTNLNVGDNAKITVFRDGQSKIVPVLMEPSPADQKPTKSVVQKELEFSVREITDIDRYDNHWASNQQGLLVSDVTPGGYSDVGGLEADDLIVSIDGQPITKTADLKTVLDHAAKTHPKSLEVYVRRDESTAIVFIEPEWNKVTSFTEN